MKIVHVVPIVSADGAFGGPLRVALNQVAELRNRGHQVELLAGWRGETAPPIDVDGVEVNAFRAHRAFPRAGFTSLISVGLWTHLVGAVRRADVVHVHCGRDLISLGALVVARCMGAVVVVQTHGMIGVDNRRFTRFVDRLAVRRLIAGVTRQLVLTKTEEDTLRDALPSVPLRTVILPNGVALPPVVPPKTSRSINILYCARLEKRKRPEVFVEAAAKVTSSLVSFSLVGPDEGELANVRSKIELLGLPERVKYEGALPYGRVLPRMSECDIYVLPSVNEPFPMSLLEAMSLGLATVSVDSCGISRSISEAGAGEVVDGSPESIAVAIDRLVSSPDLRQSMGARARDLVSRAFSICSVCDILTSVYAEALTAHRERIVIP